MKASALTAILVSVLAVICWSVILGAQIMEQDRKSICRDENWQSSYCQKFLEDWKKS